MRLFLATLISIALAGSAFPLASAACSYSYSSQTPVLTSPTISTSGNGCVWGYSNGSGYAYQYNETRVTETYTGASLVYAHSSSNSTYQSPNGTVQSWRYDGATVALENTHGGPVPRVYASASQSEYAVNGTPTASGGHFSAGYSGGILGYYYVGGPLPTANATAMPNVVRYLP